MNLANPILTEAKQAFENIRHSVVNAMLILAKVYESGVWEEVADTWGEYVQSELQISPGFASKLLAVNRAYVLEGGIKPEDLVGIDYEKLYMARALPGTVEEQIEKARTLTRRELKEEKGDEEPHEHQPITICRSCQMKLD